MKGFFFFCVLFAVCFCFFRLFLFFHGHAQWCRGHSLRTIVFLYAREINPLLLDFFHHGHDRSLTRAIPYPGKYHQSWDHACYRHREKGNVGEKHGRTRGRTERPVGVVKTTGTFPHATDRIGSRSSPGPPEGDRVCSNGVCQNTGKSRDKRHDASPDACYPCGKCGEEDHCRCCWFCCCCSSFVQEYYSCSLTNYNSWNFFYQIVLGLFSIKGNTLL